MYIGDQQNCFELKTSMKMIKHGIRTTVAFLFVMVINVQCIQSLSSSKGTSFSVPVNQEYIVPKLPLETLRTEIIHLINKHDESGKAFSRESINDHFPALHKLQISPALVPTVPAVISQLPGSSLSDELKARASLLKGGLLDPTEIPEKDNRLQKLSSTRNNLEGKDEKLKLPVVNSLTQTLDKIRQIKDPRTGVFETVSEQLHTMLAKKNIFKGIKCTSKKCKQLMNNVAKPQCKGTNMNVKTKETVPKKKNLLQTLRSLSLKTKHIQVSCAGFDPRMALTNTFPRRYPPLVKNKTYKSN